MSVTRSYDLSLFNKYSLKYEFQYFFSKRTGTNQKKIDKLQSNIK